MDVTCCVLLDTDRIEVKGDNDPNTRCVTLMLDDKDAFLVIKFKYKFTNNS